MNARNIGKSRLSTGGKPVNMGDWPTRIHDDGAGNVYICYDQSTTVDILIVKIATSGSDTTYSKTYAKWSEKATATYNLI